VCLQLLPLHDGAAGQLCCVPFGGGLGGFLFYLSSTLCSEELQRFYSYVLVAALVAAWCSAFGVQTGVRSW
jgi:hypothetical protein